MPVHVTTRVIANDISRGVCMCKEKCVPVKFIITSLYCSGSLVSLDRPRETSGSLKLSQELADTHAYHRTNLIWLPMRS